MSERKPRPLYTPVAQRPLCPVCGETSYSRQGIHPQCAEKRWSLARQVVGRPPD